MILSIDITQTAELGVKGINGGKLLLRDEVEEIYEKKVTPYPNYAN